MSQRYRDVLDHEIGARIIVGEATVRVYDGAHGVNDMHRHDRRGEKAPAMVFHAGTLGEGMRAAIAAVRTNYKEMIAAWRAT